MLNPPISSPQITRTLGFFCCALSWKAVINNHRDLVRRLNLRLGYRLNLVMASWAATVPVSSTVELKYEWRNSGVAPVLADAFPCITLKDAQDGIGAVFVDSGRNARDLPEATSQAARSVFGTVTMSFLFQPPLNNRAIVRPGVYDVFFSVGTSSGTPKIALPLAGDDGQHRYRVGRITIVPVSGISVLDSPTP